MENLDQKYAEAITYLRTRQRWTQAAEDELIRMAKAGEPLPNMMAWPPEGSPLRNPVSLMEAVWAELGPNFRR